MVSLIYSSPFTPSSSSSDQPIGKKIKTVVEFLSLRDIAQQFSEVTGEKAFLALELSKEAFEASRGEPNSVQELMYLSWEFVARAGPDSGVRVSFPVTELSYTCLRLFL